jgi:cobyrinic acid a,c-diamide synthase
MTDRLTLSYRTPVADHDHLLAVAGRRVTGHEFHRTVVEPPCGTTPAWLVDGEPVGFALDPAGLGTETVHASYLHVHWAGHPYLAQHFADAVHAYAEGSTEPDLRHHGDADLGEGLVDLAVNVRVQSPPEWLAAVINEVTPSLGAYPRTEEAMAAIAAAHGVPPETVLPTSGGAEAFTLLARATHPQRPVVVHPQFTEPEAALIAAGHPPERVILSSRDGFGLDPSRIPADADLVMIGNPTNPTSVLHPAATLRALLRPGRILVVDEAFMDAVPGEPDTMISPALPGLVVVRSLTKTWGLAGLRAGYAIGDPAVIDRMAAQQPPWSVSAPALAAIAAGLSHKAREIAAAAAEEIAEHRTVLLAGLAALGLPVVGTPRAPFVLLDTTSMRPGRAPGWVRHALRDQGFAVRRGETFPGLGPDWIRIAVRDPATSDRFVEALARVIG